MLKRENQNVDFQKQCVINSDTAGFAERLVYKVF